MSVDYTRVNWKDSPSTQTPLNAENLNKMDSAIGQIADAVNADNDEYLVASEFAAFTQYSTGDLVIHNGRLYRANKNVIPVEWPSTAFDEITVANFVNDFADKLIAKRFINGTSWIRNVGDYIIYGNQLYKVNTANEDSTWHAEKYTRLSSVSSELSRIDNRVTNLSTTVDGLSSTVNGMSSTVNSLNSDVGGLEITVNGMSSTVSELETNVGDLSGDVGDLSDAIAGIDTSTYVVTGVYSNGAWTLNHTFNEIYAALEQHKPVYGIFLNLQAVTSYVAYVQQFSNMYIYFEALIMDYMPSEAAWATNAISRRRFILDTSNELTTSIYDVGIPNEPEPLYAIELVNNDSWSYQDNPSGPFTIDISGTPISDLYEFLHVNPANFSLTYGKTDEYGYFETYYLHDVTTAQTMIDGNEFTTVTAVFTTISTHTGSPVLKQVSISGLAYQYDGLDGVTVTYSSTPL